MSDDRTPSASPHGDRNRGGNHHRDGADGDHGGHAEGDSITIETVHEEPDPARAESDQRRWVEYAPTVVIDRLSPRELDLAFPAATRDEAVEALHREREECAALSDRERERSYKQDTREAEAYLQRCSFPERLVMRIGKYACFASIAVMGSLFVAAIVGSAVDGATGWSASVMWAFVVSMLPPFPLAALWSLGSRLFYRKVHRRLLEWAAPRPGQLARGLLSYPIPTADGHYALSFPFTRWLFPLLLFFTGVHTYWLCDPGKADDRAEPEFWIWYAICVLGTVLCGFIPWWLRNNFEKRAMFAMAVVPINPVAVRVAASLFGEPSAKDQERWSTVDYPLAHFRQLR